MLELRVQANSFDEDKDKPNASVFDFTMAYIAVNIKHKSAVCKVVKGIWKSFYSCP